MKSMNSKKTKLPVKQSGNLRLKPGAHSADASLGLPKFVLRLIGREQVKQFIVPVVIRHRRD